MGKSQSKYVLKLLAIGHEKNYVGTELTAQLGYNLDAKNQAYHQLGQFHPACELFEDLTDLKV